VIKELGSTNLASYAYDDLSRRSTVTLGNGTTTSYGYDSQGALSSLAHNLTGTAQDVTYSYARNQAQEIVNQNWDNNLYGWAATGVTNTNKAYAANGLNQYTTVGANTLTYDGNGNLAGDGFWSYGYDLDNRLKTATATGFSASLAYDGVGRLRQTTIGGVVTNLLYDGVDLIGEYDGSNNVVRRYVHGPGVDEPLVWYEGSGTTNKTWLYGDHQGSIVGQADGTGTSTALYSYGPFGEPNQTTGTRFRYTGQQYLSQMGLYYYKARFYSPMLGRFLQTDPIGYQDDNNLYAYVRGNPLRWTDSLGLAPGDSYPSAADAAIAATNDINHQSITENREYAGRIYKKWWGLGSYSYTEPNAGTVASSNPGTCPITGSNEGYYHTHGGDDPRYDNENFSPADKRISDFEQKPGFVGTPHGDIKEYLPISGQPGNGTVTTIGTGAK